MNLNLKVLQQRENVYCIAYIWLRLIPIKIIHSLPDLEQARLSFPSASHDLHAVTLINMSCNYVFEKSRCRSWSSAAGCLVIIGRHNPFKSSLLFEHAISQLEYSLDHEGVFYCLEETSTAQCTQWTYSSSGSSCNFWHAASQYVLVRTSQPQMLCNLKFCC